MTKARDALRDYVKILLQAIEEDDDKKQGDVCRLIAPVVVEEVLNQCNNLDRIATALENIAEELARQNS